MIKFSFTPPTDINPDYVRKDLKKDIHSFMGRVDKAMYKEFKDEYGLGRKLYKRSTFIKNASSHEEFLSEIKPLALRYFARALGQNTSKKDVPTKKRKQVLLIRGPLKGLMPKTFFKSRKNVHQKKNGNEEWVSRLKETLYEFFYNRADKILDQEIAKIDD
jgi:hypothetical protein